MQIRHACILWRTITFIQNIFPGLETYNQNTLKKNFYVLRGLFIDALCSSDYTVLNDMITK